MKKIEVPAAPGRLINAIARIGYDTEVALCDLIDNSIDAGSSEINITMLPELHGEEGETDTIHKYIIADNGCGLSDKTVVEAFTLGSPREYPPASLGKFGLGLKSAGLALGNRIVVLSKTLEMDKPLCAILSITDIEASGKYEIDLGEIPTEYEEFWKQELQQGTILLLESLNDNQPSFSHFLPYLCRYCSVVYHLFLADTSRQLAMTINDETLASLDPLFMKEASNNGSLGDPESWDGKKPHILLEDHELPLTPDGVKATIALTHLVHPPSFEDDHSTSRDKYMIDPDKYTRRPRHGFYVYRNRRVIVLAERFHGLVRARTEQYAFRGRLMFDESADNILALDVKKRHCQLPKEVRSNLLSQVQVHIQKSANAWAYRGKLLKIKRGESKEQGANESISQTPVADLGYAPGADLSSKGAIDARNKRFEEVGKMTLSSIQDERISEEELTKRAEEKSVVIPIAGLKANAMWLPYPAVQQGAAETIINTFHSWVAEAYAAAEEDPRIMVILHQIFTALARGELEVRSIAWRDVPPNTVDLVLERFRKKVSVIAEDLADSLAAELANVSGEQPEND